MILEGAELEWDVFSKTLLKKHIQDFVDYFTPGAKVVRLVEGQLQTRVDSSFEPREVRCDVVVEVELAGQKFLEHYECQSTRQTGMAKRMLGYGYELERDHELYSLSAAVYTRPMKNLPERILTWSIPCGADGGRREVLRYEHEVLDLCNTPVEEFRKLNKDGFRPLMLLAEGGATTAVLDEVLDALYEHDCQDAIAIAIVFASRVLTSENLLQDQSPWVISIPLVLSAMPYDKITELLHKHYSQQIRSNRIQVGTKSPL